MYVSRSHTTLALAVVSNAYNLGMAGKFIVIEGLDRAGKSTQCARTAKYIRSKGIQVQELKFPDRTTPIGQMIDAYLRNASELSDEAVHLLFSANRWEAAANIRKLLEDDTWLVVDRYVYSGIAFSAAKGLDFEWCRAPDVGLPVPDLVVFLDLDAGVASQRGGYGEERYENRDMQARVREQFLKLKNDSWAWINAAGSLSEVSRQIENAVLAIGV